MESTPVQSIPQNNLDHGFGLKNIEKTLDRYHGIMDYCSGEVFKLFIRVPITDPKQRTIDIAPTPPLKSSTNKGFQALKHIKIHPTSRADYI